MSPEHRELALTHRPHPDLGLLKSAKQEPIGADVTAMAPAACHAALHSYRGPLSSSFPLVSCALCTRAHHGSVPVWSPSASHPPSPPPGTYAEPRARSIPWPPAGLQRRPWCGGGNVVDLTLSAARRPRAPAAVVRSKGRRARAEHGGAEFVREAAGGAVCHTCVAAPQEALGTETVSTPREDLEAGARDR